ncbi:MAG: PqqD family peptide modification chaperone [Candidatus Jorgensenbacteria bacterium]|nr:PqqD family peptide modification chaperone [Candidatus Jorgensenbacteria bacterium]
MLVKIRSDGDQIFAYFIDSRRIVGVNELGAKILNSLFNQQNSVDEITHAIAIEYGVQLAEAQVDVTDFINKVEEELSPKRFSLITQTQTDIPLGVELEVTTGCNLRCLHCFQDNYSEVFMPKGKVFEILDILAHAGIFEVSVIGGEPFLHPDIQEILKHCQKHEFAIDTVTNGLLIDETTADWLASVERLSIFVSLDGIESEHDRIRGKGTFRRVEAAIQRLQQHGIEVEVISTLNAINAPTYREILDYCKTIGVICNFNLFKPFKSAHESLTLRPETFFDIVIDLFRLRQAGVYEVGISNAAIVGKLLNGRVYNECRAAQSGLVINTTGQMLPCPSLVYAGYYRPEDLPLFDKKFIETWKNHEIFKQFRLDGLGGCQARSFIFHKDTTTPDPYSITAFNEHLLKQDVFPKPQSI